MVLNQSQEKGATHKIAASVLWKLLELLSHPWWMLIPKNKTNENNSSASHIIIIIIILL